MLGHKIVARLTPDFQCISTQGNNEGNNINQLANLINYKIRTESDLGNKSLNNNGLGVTVVDLGKQLLQYARDSDVKGVRNILKRGAPFTNDWLGMSAIHFAAMNNQVEICDDLLKSGINKDGRTKVDRSPLHLACFYGNEKIVEMLLAKKCAVNPRDMLRMTPLHWAVEKGHKSIVRVLLKHNADVTVVSKFGKTPIALAVMTEQADLLAELEAARQSQANKVYSEAHEKETSEAVNSIMGPEKGITEESTKIRKYDLHGEDNSQMEFEAKIADLDSIKETGILDNSTINLFKSHGISMQNDEDNSKDLLTTALQNGRQLILSEGGKLLLNDSKRFQINNINMNNNSPNTAIVPMRLKNEIPLSQAIQTNKVRPNIVSKAKDNPAMSRNKNIRIISLNDFKKLYGNSNIKTVQKMTGAMAAGSRMGQIAAEDAQIDNAERKLFSNVQIRQTQPEIIMEDGIIEEDDTGVIQINPTDAEIDTVETDKPAAKQTPTTITKSSAPVRLHMGPVQIRHLPTRQQLQTVTTKTGNNLNSSSSSSPTIMPLPSTSEICRQLLELRRQNDELRRKFEIAQKEKDDLKQRLERLEEMLLVEKTDEDYMET